MENFIGIGRSPRNRFGFLNRVFENPEKCHCGCGNHDAERNGIKMIRHSGTQPAEPTKPLSHWNVGPIH